VFHKHAWLYALNNAQVVDVTGAKQLSIGGLVINAGGANVINAGGANVINAGGANVEVVYGGQVIAVGGANLITGSGANLISDKGLGLISDKGLGLISDKGLGLISDKGLGLTGPNVQLIETQGSQLDFAKNAAMMLASGGGFASGGIFSGLISDGGILGAADLASAARAHPKPKPLGSGSSVVAGHGQRGHLTLVFNRQGTAQINKLAKLNAQRKRHHKRLLRLVLRVTTTFKPATGAPAVTRTRTIVITPVAPSKPKKKK
jgi:hypothetical protein